MNQPPSLDHLKSQRKPIHRVAREHKESLTPLQRLAVAITRRIGTMGFFFVIFVWTVLWLGWNFLAPVSMRFDPPMGFVLWLFISNMIQIFLMPLLMIGQNLQSDHADRRAESDFDVNVKAEREIEAVLLHLEHQNQILYALMQHVGMDVKQVLGAKED